MNDSTVIQWQVVMKKFGLPYNAWAPSTYSMESVCVCVCVCVSVSVSVSVTVLVSVSVSVTLG